LFPLFINRHDNGDLISPLSLRERVTAAYAAVGEGVCRFLIIIIYSVTIFLHGCAGGPSPVAGEQSESVRLLPGTVSSASQDEFKKAVASMKNNDYQAAIPVLERILLNNPGLPGAQINLAIAYMNLQPFDKEHYRKAEQALLQAVAAAPKDPVAHNQLGLVYRRTGRFQDALRAYDKALDLQRNYAAAHLNMAILCDIYLQDLPCAMEHFEKYGILVPDQMHQVSLWLTDLRKRAGIAEPAAPAPAPVAETASAEGVTAETAAAEEIQQ
jgi:tetratricopeptide (TPR) repeat protein